MKEEITLLQEKNRHRKALLKHYKQIHEKDLKEIERLNNIINELEKEISKHIALCTDITLNDILDKLQELKGDSSNE